MHWGAVRRVARKAYDFLGLHGPRCAAGELSKTTAFTTIRSTGPLLIDMAPTILAALGAPASIEHSGRVLHEVVGSDAVVGKRSGEPTSAKPAVQIPGMPSGSEESNVSDTEHLRSLGYLE
jgi:hypothetical protein